MDIVNIVATRDTQMLSKLSQLLESDSYCDSICPLLPPKLFSTNQLEPAVKICVGAKSLEKMTLGEKKKSQQRDINATASSTVEVDDQDYSNSSRAISFRSWQSKLITPGSKSSTGNNAATSRDSARNAAGLILNIGGTMQVQYYLLLNFNRSHNRMRLNIWCWFIVLTKITYCALSFQPSRSKFSHSDST